MGLAGLEIDRATRSASTRGVRERLRRPLCQQGSWRFKRWRTSSKPGTLQRSRNDVKGPQLPQLLQSLSPTEDTVAEDPKEPTGPRGLSASGGMSIRRERTPHSVAERRRRPPLRWATSRRRPRGAAGSGGSGAAGTPRPRWNSARRRSISLNPRSMEQGKRQLLGAFGSVCAGPLCQLGSWRSTRWRDFFEVGNAAEVEERRLRIPAISTASTVLVYRGHGSGGPEGAGRSTGALRERRHVDPAGTNTTERRGAQAVASLAVGNQPPPAPRIWRLRRVWSGGPSATSPEHRSATLNLAALEIDGLTRAAAARGVWERLRRPLCQLGSWRSTRWKTFFEVGNAGEVEERRQGTQLPQPLQPSPQPTPSVAEHPKEPAGPRGLSASGGMPTRREGRPRSVAERRRRPPSRWATSRRRPRGPAGSVGSGAAGPPRPRRSTARRRSISLHSRSMGQRGRQLLGAFGSVCAAHSASWAAGAPDDGGTSSKSGPLRPFET